MIRFQVVRFALVGIVASIVHTALFNYILAVTENSAVFANTVAFFFAFVVSYTGHYLWTFRTAQRPKAELAQTLPKFAVVALTGYALNTAIALIVVDMLAAPAWQASVLMLTITPVVLYCLASFWAFALPGTQVSSEDQPKDGG